MCPRMPLAKEFGCYNTCMFSLKKDRYIYVAMVTHFLHICALYINARPIFTTRLKRLYASKHRLLSAIWFIFPFESWCSFYMVCGTVGDCVFKTNSNDYVFKTNCKKWQVVLMIKQKKNLY